MWRAAACVAGMMILLWTGVARAVDVVENALGICASCHGADGLPKDPTVPIIWGQRAKYIEKQLLDYRSGDRDNQIMSSMAEAIRRDDVPPAAEILAGRAWPRHGDGAELAPATIETCKACHGVDLLGGASPEGEAPRLAGQFFEYLNEQMGQFAREQRANQKTMTAMMKALTADERTEIAKYLAGL
jgi:cytochrome c553